MYDINVMMDLIKCLSFSYHFTKYLYSHLGTHTHKADHSKVKQSKVKQKPDKRTKE